MIVLLDRSSTCAYNDADFHAAVKIYGIGSTEQVLVAAAVILLPASADNFINEDGSLDPEYPVTIAADSLDWVVEDIRDLLQKDGQRDANQQ